MLVSAGIFINDLIGNPDAHIKSKLAFHNLLPYTVNFNDNLVEVLLTSRYYLNQIADNNKYVIYSYKETADVYKNIINALPKSLLKYIPDKFYIFEEFEQTSNFKITLNILSEEYLQIERTYSNTYKLTVWQH